MPNQNTIEERVATLERAVAELQGRQAGGTSSWIERFTGSFKDDPVFAEIVEYGRALRAADRPEDEP